MRSNHQRELSRRAWLTGVAAATGAFVLDREAAGQGAAAGAGLVDVHHHHSQTGEWTPGRSLEAMDRNGVAAAVLSRPGVAFGDNEKARKLAREANEFGAKIVRDNPKRFGLFATLPLFDVEGSLKEIEYAYDVLKVDGVCFSTSYGNASSGTKWPGDAAFAPIFNELNMRRAVAFIHPTVPYYYNTDYRLQSGSTRGVSGVNETALENQFDTARAVVSLLINGTVMRCPNIRFIFTHGGGGLPFLHERLQHLIAEDLPKTEWTTGDGRYKNQYFPNGFDAEVQKLYFDTVRVVHPANFALMLKLMNPQHILFGTDFPIVPISETVSRLPGLALERGVLRGVERGNAAALFPRLRT